MVIQDKIDTTFMLMIDFFVIFVATEDTTKTNYTFMTFYG